MLRRATIGLKWVALSALIVGAFTYAVADRNPLGVAGGKAIAITATPEPLSGAGWCPSNCQTHTVKVVRRNTCEIRDWCAGECEYYKYDTQSCEVFRIEPRNCKGTITKKRRVKVYRTGCFESPLGCVCDDDTSTVVDTVEIEYKRCIKC